MVRFYKRIQDQWFYKECWQDGDRVIFHHGVVGNEGKVDSEPCLDFSAYYNSFKRKYEKQGYSEFSPDHAETIVLKYALKSSEEAESITKSVIPLLNERLTEDFMGIQFHYPKKVQYEKNGVCGPWFSTKDLNSYQDFENLKTTIRGMTRPLTLKSGDEQRRLDIRITDEAREQIRGCYLFREYGVTVK